jgi:serine phosphatase RsbU (regulator of sigma subunit)/pSer/pThr/pTyr-binding forkhead associated (FHA) protein
VETTTPPRAEVTVYSPLLDTPYRQQLQTQRISIGRASECTIPIKDRYLSRKHAEIVPAGATWLLKDLGSANGTYLNGARVHGDAALKAGDRIRLGDTEIVFDTSEPNTDRVLALADTSPRPNIAIPMREIDSSVDNTDSGRLKTLNTLARELIEDRPMDQLFGFIVDKVMEHLRPSRAAIALLAADGHSFSRVELRRQNQSDTSELTISNTLLKELVEEKKALSYVNVPEDEKLGRAHSIVMQGIYSILCAPITIGDAVVGVLYVDFLFTQRPISAEDVKLVGEIARFAAIKLETTRLREESIQKRILDEELKTASNIQRRLLPHAPSGVPGFTFAGFNQPCRTVSGDYYDFVVRPDGRVYFVIGDVSGKGVTAGLMMAGLQVAFRIFSKNDPDPATFVGQLNSSLRESLPRSKFVSLFLGRLDTNTGVIEYVNAGHTPPLWIHDSNVEEVVAGDILLGILTGAQYVNRRIHLQPGDSLILFTDGVSEARNTAGDELGTETLSQSLREYHNLTADAVATAVTESVLSHAGDVDALDDDVTIVVVSRDGVNASRDYESTVRSRSSLADF